jgi:hypothetical protein
VRRDAEEFDTEGEDYVFYYAKIVPKNNSKFSKYSDEAHILKKMNNPAILKVKDIFEDRDNFIYTLFKQKIVEKNNVQNTWKGNAYHILKGLADAHG